MQKKRTSRPLLRGLRVGAAALVAVLAGGIVAFLEYFVGAEDGLAEFAGDFGFGACVSCHCY